MAEALSASTQMEKSDTPEVIVGHTTDSKQQIQRAIILNFFSTALLTVAYAFISLLILRRLTINLWL